ncbi:MAG: chorismate pyruvate-lyase family protein [Bryobacteraceae bacterium]
MAFLAQLDAIDGRRLNLLERLLLVNDGTLTDALEMAFLEPIALEKIAIELTDSGDWPEALEAEPGSSIMERRIVLRGEQTRRPFVYAESWIVLDRLPAGMREKLVGSGNPIGRLWTEYKLETRKEILRFWRQPAGAIGASLGVAERETLLARSYRVFRHDQPIMIITEYFRANL